MKKFNSDGGYRKDIKKDVDDRDLNKYKGHSLEESKERFGDTVIFSEEDIELIKNEYNQGSEEQQMHR